jgi:hypothetical protein
MTEAINDQLVLVVGYSGTGKSASLRNIKNQEDWMYLNSEAGKRLPFPNKFRNNGGYRIEDPYQVHEALDVARQDPTVKGVIVDSITFLMDMLETQYVINSANTQKAWGDFAQFFKVLMQEKVTRLQKPAIFTAHVKDELDEKNMEMKVSVPVKGSLKNNGIEAYFSTVVSAKKMTLKDLEKYKNPLLTVSEEETELGYKHVFQTRPTKGTTGERIRSPMGMFSKEQTYIDNDAQLLLNHLNKYYGVTNK